MEAIIRLMPQLVGSITGLNTMKKDKNLLPCQSGMIPQTCSPQPSLYTDYAIPVSSGTPTRSTHLQLWAPSINISSVSLD